MPLVPQVAVYTMVSPEAMEPIAFNVMVTVPAVADVPAAETDVTVFVVAKDAAAGRFRDAWVMPVARLPSLQAIPMALRAVSETVTASAILAFNV